MSLSVDTSVLASRRTISEPPAVALGYPELGGRTLPGVWQLIHSQKNFRTGCGYGGPSGRYGYRKVWVPRGITHLIQEKKRGNDFYRHSVWLGG